MIWIISAVGVLVMVSLVIAACTFYRESSDEYDEEEMFRDIRDTVNDIRRGNERN